MVTGNHSGGPVTGFELLDVTLPAEVSNDPSLLKDIALTYDGTPLPVRLRILKGAVSLMIGQHSWFFRLRTQ